MTSVMRMRNTSTGLESRRGWDWVWGTGRYRSYFVEQDIRLHGKPSRVMSPDTSNNGSDMTNWHVKDTGFEPEHLVGATQRAHTQCSQ
jgi:hypothetical protein